VVQLDATRCNLPPHAGNAYASSVENDTSSAIANTRERQSPVDELAAPGAAVMPLSPAEPLSVPHPKRLTCSHVTGEEGAGTLRLDYGRKEVLFDEAHLFPFGEQLANETSFTGARAMTWGPGYTWDELRPLLEALLEQGILQRGHVTADPRGIGLVPSTVPPSVCPVARYWSIAECESITRELSGHAVELGHLEVFLPVYRVAHAALDADDRQVGEANVNPPMLRLDRETEWRVCQYPGGRYRDEMPMNITALKAMIKHWKPMMATLTELRAYVAARLGISRSPWTIGELHLLSCAVLALPAYQLMKHGGSTPQRPVHPVLSSLFRITDGVRMATIEMMHSIERTCSPDAPLRAAELYTRVEQQSLLISPTGVCAGPKNMIDDFLATAVDGLPAPGVTGAEVPAEVRELLSELPNAIDYACYGMQVWALSFSVWLAMSRAYEALLEILDAAGDGIVLPRLRRDLGAIEWKQIARDREREIHMAAYVTTYAHARHVARVPLGDPQLRTQIAPVGETSAHRTAARRLRHSLASRLPGGPVDRIVDVLVGYIREEQAILAAITPVVAAINTLLDRPRPERPVTVRDVHVNHFLKGNPEKFPYLFDSLDEALGIRIASTADAIEITDRALGPAGRLPPR
jgi:hypothetical protein